MGVSEANEWSSRGVDVPAEVYELTSGLHEELLLLLVDMNMDMQFTAGSVCH